MLVDAAVAAANGVIYGLVTRFFEEKRSYPPALALAREPQGAEVVVLMNMVAFSVIIIWVKPLNRLPQILLILISICLIPELLS